MSIIVTNRWISLQSIFGWELIDVAMLLNHLSMFYRICCSNLDMLCGLLCNWCALYTSAQLKIGTHSLENQSTYQCPMMCKIPIDCNFNVDLVRWFVFICFHRSMHLISVACLIFILLYLRKSTVCTLHINRTRIDLKRISHSNQLPWLSVSYNCFKL